MQKLSRSKIELFIECPRCFWMDVKRGVKRPQGAPYTINNAVDYLLKQEFDVHREKETRHPVMEKYNIDAVPYQNEKLNSWRHNFTGVGCHHTPTDFWVYGALDDVWVKPSGELIVVDYKATGANQHTIYDSYKRQMEIYQWLLRENGFRVADVGYFVFARVNKGDGFGNGEAALSFDLFVEPQEGDDSWIEKALHMAKKTLDEEATPAAKEECAYCLYRHRASELLT